MTQQSQSQSQSQFEDLHVDDLEIDVLNEERLPSLLALFEAASSSCFCRYWHFTGTKNDWLDRCANRPEENAAELAEAVRAGDPSSFGLLALARSDKTSETKTAVGWMKLTARANVPKLRKLPVYRSLDLGDEATTLSIGCMLVHPKARGKGVARALVNAAVTRFGEQISDMGAGQAPHSPTSIEGYPRRSSDPLYPEEAWQGPERIFIALGFEAVHDVPPYPVYVKRLGRAHR